MFILKSVLLNLINITASPLIKGGKYPCTSVVKNKSTMFPYVALKIITLKYGDKVQVRNTFARTTYCYMSVYTASVRCERSVGPKGA